MGNCGLQDDRAARFYIVQPLPSSKAGGATGFVPARLRDRRRLPMGNGGEAVSYTSQMRMASRSEASLSLRLGTNSCAT